MLSHEIRPRAFAGVELLLDLVHIARGDSALDIESMLILHIVSEATMRPLVLGDKVPAAVRDMATPPDEYRGSISRMLVADRIGMARETVRRKINALIEAGLIYEDEHGRVRTPRNLGDPAIQQKTRDTFAAVQRYDARLRQLGCEGVCEPQPGKDRDAA